MYVFVRQDIPVAHQIVQANHAVFHLAAIQHPNEDLVPNIIVVGLPGVAALRRVVAKLQANYIPHYLWTEPDNNFGFTAIATAPITGEQRAALKNYRLWKYTADAVSGTSASKAESVGENPTVRTNSLPGSGRQLTALECGPGTSLVESLE